MFEVERQPGAPEMTTPQLRWVQKALEAFYEKAKKRCVYLTAAPDLPANSFEIHTWDFPSFAVSQVFTERLAFSINQQIKEDPQSPGGRVSFGLQSLYYRVTWSDDITRQIVFDAREINTK